MPQVVRRYARRRDRFPRGAYVNVLNDEGQAGIHRADSPHKLCRLTTL